MNLQGKRAAIVTLGCKVNQYETDAMYGMLKEAGVMMVDPKEAADIYIVNTCSVTNMAERKSRQMLHRAKKKNPDVVVVAVGCYAQVGKEELSKDTNIDLIIGNNKKKDLIHILEEHMGEKESAAESIEVIDIAHDQEYESLHVEQLKEHTRAYIKVQDGCNQFCSYCIIPYARGRVRSRKMEEVLEEITNLTKHGCQEFVITGIHVTSYGKDLGDVTLIDLLEEIAKIPEVKRIRLGSLEPGFITKDTLDRLSKMESFCPHFHLSLQSGCDSVLKRMNRKYTTQDIREKCKAIREHFQYPALTTDIIVGFPGETEEEFAQTKEYLKRIHFYEMHIFKYSRRQGTRAAVMEHQVPEEIKTKRSAQLLALAESMSREFRAYYVGKEEEVLFEEPMEVDGETWYTGYTKEYVKIAAKTAEPLDNVMKRGRVEAALTDEIYRMKL